MSPDFEALVAGHICLDIQPDLIGVGREPFEDIFLPGRLVAVGPVTYSTGGAVTNTGLALDRLGIVTRLAGKLGDDLFGQAIRQIVAARRPGLADGMVVDASASTSYSIIINYPGVDRIFLHYAGANDTFQACDVPYALLEQTRLFHFGYPPVMRSTFIDSGAQLAEIFLRARHTGVTTSLDMAFPDPSSEAGRVDWRVILGGTLPQVDIFLPSVEEILFMLHGETYREMCRATPGSNLLALITPQLLSDLGRELIAMGAKIVGLKLGDRGMYLRTSSRDAIDSIGRARPADPDAWAGVELWAPCFKVAVAGTTGSGDATIAGFLAGLLRDLPVEQALTMAVAVGACKVEASDALSGICTWEETSRRLESGWVQHSLKLDAPGWKFDPTCGLWRGPCA
ncbi:carbohydrate kinase family protein [bacterium]|nr:MAG: carbohydrate kinase family protein [bacterium]